MLKLQRRARSFDATHKNLRSRDGPGFAFPFELHWRVSQPLFRHRQWLMAAPVALVRHDHYMQYKLFYTAMTMPTHPKGVSLLGLIHLLTLDDFGCRRAGA